MHKKKKITDGERALDEGYFGSPLRAEIFAAMKAADELREYRARRGRWFLYICAFVAAVASVVGLFWTSS